MQSQNPLILEESKTHKDMKYAKFFILAALPLFFACNGRSDEDTKKLIEAEYQHKLDSIKLAQAQAQLDAQQSAPAAAKPSSSSTSSAPVKSQATFSSEFSWLSQRRVTEADLAGLSSWELSIYRNAIYAMHGRKFVKAQYRNYFSQFSWYQPLYDEVQLTSLEQQNVAFIKAHE